MLQWGEGDLGRTGIGCSELGGGGFGMARVRPGKDDACVHVWKCREAHERGYEVHLYKCRDARKNECWVHVNLFESREARERGHRVCVQLQGGQGKRVW